MSDILYASLDEAGRAPDPARRAMIITDENVRALYGDRCERALRSAGFETAVYAMPPGEASKTIQTLTDIYAAMAAFGMTRQDAVLALGGGVPGDVGALAAATYMRGLPLYMLPTTLIAQSDSALGGKAAVDLPQGKNLMGVFYPARRVLIDETLLYTLPKREMQSGIAEVIKCAMIADADMLPSLTRGGTQHLSEQARRAREVKLRLTALDPMDHAQRRLLNFGHTLGHAIEAESGYTLSHGACVSIGMVLITRASQLRGLTRPGTLEALTACLNAHGLPVQMPPLDARRVMNRVCVDKKRLGNDIMAVLLRAPGDAFVTAVPPELMEDALCITR